MKKKLISSLLAVTILGTLLGITAPVNAATTNAAQLYEDHVKLSLGYIDIQPTFQPKVNEKLTLSTSAYGGSGVYLYQFEIRNSTGMVVYKNYNKTGIINWTPTVADNYQVEFTVIDLTTNSNNTNDFNTQYRPIYVRA